MCVWLCFCVSVWCVRNHQFTETPRPCASSAWLRACVCLSVCQERHNNQPWPNFRGASLPNRTLSDRSCLLLVGRGSKCSTFMNAAHTCDSAFRGGRSQHAHMSIYVHRYMDFTIYGCMCSRGLIAHDGFYWHQRERKCPVAQHSQAK